jgi:hypothetical protein
MLGVSSSLTAAATVQTRLQRVAVESRGLTAADLAAFSRARSLNLTKYSASVSGRMPDLI